MKHAKHFLLMTAMLLGSVGASAGAYFEVDGIWYETNDNSSLTVDVIAPKDGTKYTGDIVIPSRVEYVNNTWFVNSIKGFSNCQELTSVVIPNNVLYVYSAFVNCSALASITCNAVNPPTANEATFTGVNKATCIIYVPASAVDAYKADAYWGLFKNIQPILIASGTCGDNLTWSLTEDGELTIEGTGAMTNYSGTTIDGQYVTSAPWNLYLSDITQVIVGEDVTTIGENAFRGMGSLTSVSLFEGLTQIGKYAFIRCESLSTINIPSTVTCIGQSAFNYCSLTSLNLPSGLKAIEESSFVGNDFTSLVLPEGLELIGYNAFCDCNSLNSVIFPNSLYVIGEDAFNLCEKLQTITFGNGLTEIGRRAFHDCSGLVELTLPQQLETIGQSAFSGCTNLESISLPNSVTSIGDYAFQNCSNLLIFDTGSGISAISNYCFQNCRKLSSITLGKSVATIGNEAFYGCTSLTTIICKAQYPPTAALYPFNDLPRAECTLYVPASAIGSYKATTTWSNFGTIVPLTDALVTGITLNESRATIVEGNTLTLTATVTPGDADDTSVTWSSSNDGVATVDNTGKVTAIAPGTATITATANDGSEVSASCEVMVMRKEIPVTGIELNRTSATLTEGATLALTATVTPNDATDKFLTWSSSNIAVATVDNTGKVTAIAPGTATITATANDGSGVSTQCKVTVVKKDIPVTGIELNRISAALTEGATLALTVTVTPSDADDTSVTWSSSDPNVAAVDNTGKVTAIAPGAATITATANDGSGVSASCKVTVVKKEIPVTGIELNRISATLTEGATLALTATVTPSDADDTSVTWSSSDPNVATVDNNGKVTAIAPGTATITATANDGSGVSASCKVTVSSASYVITYLVDGEVYATEALSHGATIVAPDAPTKEGHTFSGWSGLPETMPAKDITVSAIFTVNKYKVTFIIDGVVIANYTQDYGTPIVPPTMPEREGYTFSGWGDVAQTVPASDVTYEGSYSVNSYTITYLVDGEVVHSESVNYGTTITVLDAPVKEGHTFSGWSGLPETMPAHDVTVSATFSINKYLVTFMIDGVVIASNSLEYGSIITIPSVPDREGYTFNGWGDVAQTVPAHDVIYDASYTANIYKVYYFVGATLVHITEVAYGEPIPEYVYEPTEEGYTFLGWIGETYNTMPAHDVTYTANIDDAIEQLTIGNAEIIYDLTGRKVTDTENLKGGIYIINGKKVVIND